MVAISKIDSQQVYFEQLTKFNSCWSLRATKTDLIGNSLLMHIIEKLKNMVQPLFLKKGEPSSDQLVTLRITEFVQKGIENNWIDCRNPEIKKLARFAGIVEEPFPKSSLRGMIYYSQKIAIDDDLIINSNLSKKDQSFTITPYKESLGISREDLQQLLKDRPPANYIVFVYTTARSPSAEITENAVRQLFSDGSKFNLTLPFCALNLITAEGEEFNKISRSMHEHSKCYINLSYVDKKVTVPEDIEDQWKRFEECAKEQKRTKQYSDNISIPQSDL